MELRRYWEIIWKRWRLIGLLLAVVAVASGINFAVAGKTYTATVQALLNQVPSSESGSFFLFDRYYNWLSSEYLVDDYTIVLESRAFADDVYATLQAQGVQPLPAADRIQTMMDADRKHRVVRLRVHAQTPGLAIAVANAAADTLEKNRLKYYGQADGGDAAIGVIDRAYVAPSNTAMLALNFALRVLAALVLGIVLAFLLDYLDDTVRGRADVEKAVGLPVLGSIPRVREKKRAAF